MAAWLSDLLFGPSVTERMAKQRREIELQKQEVETSITTLSKQRTRACALGDNEVHAGRDSQADAHYAKVFQLERQIARQRRSAARLQAVETRLQEAEQMETMARNFSQASRMSEAANLRLPGSQVQRDAHRMARANDEFKTKAEIIEEATAFDEDDEDEDGASAVQEQRNRIAALRAAAAQQRMPEVGAKPRVVSPLSSAAAAADNSLGLPSVQPLPLDKGKR